MINQLHYISQKPKNGTHLDAINKVLGAGCKWIQLRIKDLPKKEILDLAVQANDLCTQFDAKLIVNDHPDIAVQAGAYGLHLGLLDMPIPKARMLVGPKMIIGGTANTFEHILQRVMDGADYIGLGPFRYTSTKQNLSPILGLPGYETIMKKVHGAGLNIPVIAIGGIDTADVSALMQTGVYGIALSAALTNQYSLQAQIETIYRDLQILLPIIHPVSNP
jgi:thiamine-phosphate pyrophosphorylase